MPFTVTCEFAECVPAPSTSSTVVGVTVVTAPGLATFNASPTVVAPKVVVPPAPVVSVVRSEPTVPENARFPAAVKLPLPATVNDEPVRLREPPRAVALRSPVALVYPSSSPLSSTRVTFAPAVATDAANALVESASVMS